MIRPGRWLSRFVMCSLCILVLGRGSWLIWREDVKPVMRVAMMTQATSRTDGTETAMQRHRQLVTTREMVWITDGAKWARLVGDYYSQLSDETKVILRTSSNPQILPELTIVLDEGQQRQTVSFVLLGLLHIHEQEQDSIRGLVRQ